MTINEETRTFIQNHLQDDVRQLALQAGRYPLVDMTFALDQIAGRQKARTKLPSWYSGEELIYPPHISMEQCSSEPTARYKAELASGEDFSSLVDLTGGFGVDFSYMARSFAKATYVEQQEHLCEIARHNFRQLGITQAEVVHGDGVEYLHQLVADPQRTIYLDPARRDSHGAKVYGIEDCTPNLLEIEQELLGKSGRVIVKLSPMLDIHAAIRALHSVCEVHVVSVGNECKELLFVLSKAFSASVALYCINDGQKFVCAYENSTLGALSLASPSLGSEEWQQKYLYEPNASIMKAGCFSQLSARYPVSSLGRNSHLFVSDEEIIDFPGRRFRISRMTSMNKKELKKNLSGISQANIAVRNFPLSVADLRKRLKMKDGGEVYIFATTLGEKDHVLFVCYK